jgi:biopolymer transport protein TolR
VALSGGRRGAAESAAFRDINVTPLVDVMLVLLVVFIVTAPLLTTGLHVDLPEVNADERIVFGEQDITADLERVLQANKRVQTEHELYIMADKKAHYGVVARAVAAARAAGVTSLNLLVEPEEDKK